MVCYAQEHKIQQNREVAAKRKVDFRNPAKSEVFWNGEQQNPEADQIGSGGLPGQIDQLREKILVDLL